VKHVQVTHEPEALACFEYECDSVLADMEQLRCHLDTEAFNIFIVRLQEEHTKKTLREERERQKAKEERRLQETEIKRHFRIIEDQE